MNFTIEYISSNYHSYQNLNIRYDYIFYDKNLSRSSLTRKAIPIDAGESLKAWEGVSDIINTFQSLGITRQDRVLVIGGGTMQDAFGFVCSIYSRGVGWSYLPTTLGAMCDSCIGGKTSINVGGSKNIVGTFSDPEKIYIDFSWLMTASKNSILSGLGEMNHIFAVAQRYDLMIKLEKEYKKDTPNWSHLVRACLEIKSSFIEEDKFDKGKRLLLNYGHTFGHALESAAFTPHGIAVAWGAMLSNRLSYESGLMSEELTNYLNNRFQWIVSEAEAQQLEWADVQEDFFESLLKDKKNKKGAKGKTKIGCILMKEGQAVLDHIYFENLKGRINNVCSNWEDSNTTDSENG